MDLDAEIRLKKLSSIEEIKEYTVDLSKTAMQNLRVRNSNEVYCKYNEVRHLKKKEGACGIFVNCIRKEALDCSQLRL